MRKHAGYLVMAIALIHEAVGLIVYASPLGEIIQAGVFNSVNPPYWERDAAFWFLMFGIMLFVLGYVAQWTLKHVGYVPAGLSWGLLIVCAIGVMLMPASGFWLAIPVAIMMLRTGEDNPIHLSAVSS